MWRFKTKQCTWVRICNRVDYSVLRTEMQIQCRVYWAVGFCCLAGGPWGHCTGWGSQFVSSFEHGQLRITYDVTGRSCKVQTDAWGQDCPCRRKIVPCARQSLNTRKIGLSRSILVPGAQWWRPRCTAWGQWGHAPAAGTQPHDSWPGPTAAPWHSPKHRK